MFSPVRLMRLVRPYHGHILVTIMPHQESSAAKLCPIKVPCTSRHRRSLTLYQSILVSERMASTIMHLCRNCYGDQCLLACTSKPSPPQERQQGAAGAQRHSQLTGRCTGSHMCLGGTCKCRRPDIAYSAFNASSHPQHAIKSSTSQ